MEFIAIVGIGCRFPGANNPEAFWQLLKNGEDAIGEIPSERWQIDRVYDPNPATPEKMNTRHGGFLHQIDRFDPSFFRISPNEANYIDPQQRLLLEVAWEALENAAIVPKDLAGSRTGVYIGVGNFDYHKLIYKNLSQINPYSSTGTYLSITANRLSYLLDLRGPSMAIDTGCSASLVAVHLACQSLQNQESNLCLVGGVNLMLSPEPTIAFSQARMMASDGRCKTFDASADGYVRGEGCGVVVLKRLTDALRDNDRILSIIRGSAVNQDGLSNGLTAPNGPAQQAVIRQALANAKVQPAQISYVEAHGTGTSLGDPIEIKALKAVLSEGRSIDRPCWIGSVKTNIGHLETAAGIAGLIKVVLSLQHQEIPSHLHLKKLNPYISFEGTSFAIPTEHKPWLVSAEPRLAGISSFGFGGTNSHVIVEEAPLKSQKSKIKSQNSELMERSLHLLTLSAKTAPALRELAQKYATYLQLHPEVSIADICYTANTRRSHFHHRLAVVAASNEELRQQLINFANGEETFGLSYQELIQPQPTHKKIAFLFAGQGSQYVGMGRQLYETQPTFRKAIDRCDQILQTYLGKSIIEIIYHSSIELDKTAYTQPALFTLEYALYELWRSWGIEPAVVMGHSVGEYVAATVAGVFSLEDGLKLIVSRGKLMQSLPNNGAMAAVFASENQVKEAIKAYSSQAAIAAINSPKNIVISGAAEIIQQITANLQAQGIEVRNLKVSHAFHSPLIEPILEPLEKAASQVSYQELNIPLISNLTGQILQPGEKLNARYWRNHAQEPVQFMAGIDTLLNEGFEIFLEISPKPTLSNLGKQCQQEKNVTWLSSLATQTEDWRLLLNSLSTLYLQGSNIDWRGVEQDYSRNLLSLPTYPFQRQTYWYQQVDPTVDRVDRKEEHKPENNAIPRISRREQIIATLQALVGKALQIKPANININAAFLELGADSLMLLEALRQIENSYKVKISIRQIFEELKSINSLAMYIEQNLSIEEEEIEPDSSQPNNKQETQQLDQTMFSQPTSESTKTSETSIERIIAKQLQVMSGLM
ncbi:MAG: beta-ketoacyl synthase N-terminal-like domain-containing protein, partial [Phormidium sp.]